MPSQKGKRAKGVHMTEQQPKTPQIIDIVEMPPTADIVQSPPTQNGSQTPDTAQIEDILQMTAQMVDIQPLKRVLGGNISESTLSPPMNGPTVLPREVWLYTLENGKN